MGARIILIMAVIAALVIGGFAWYLKHAPSESETIVLTPEAKTYVKNLKLSDVGMQAADSYVQQTMMEITGKLTNAGDRALARVELNCVFYDVRGTALLHERVPIVKSNLKPGETRAFRLPFDNIPAEWNNRMPQLVIARIVFGS